MGEKMYRVSFTQTLTIMEKVVKAENEKEAEKEAAKSLCKYDWNYDDVKIEEVEKYDEETYREEV